MREKYAATGPITEALAMLCHDGHRFNVIEDAFGQPIANVCSQCGGIIDLRDRPLIRRDP